MIADSAKAVGDQDHAGVSPSTARWPTTAVTRNYDLLLGNDRQYSNTPVDVLPVHLPAADRGEPDDGQLRAVHRTRPPGTSTKQLDKTPTTNKAAYQAIMSKLQTTFLQDLPAIPLWYNGMWSMVNTQYWTNWPSSDGGQFTPTSWRNYWQMTSIDMLTHLKPPRARKTRRDPVTAQHPSRSAAGRGVAPLARCDGE